MEHETRSRSLGHGASLKRKDNFSAWFDTRSYQCSRDVYYCKFRYFARVLFSRNFAYKIKSSRNGEITQSFTVIGKSCLSREFLAWQICLIKLVGKIKFSRKFPDLQFNQPL